MRFWLLINLTRHHSNFFLKTRKVFWKSDTHRVNNHCVKSVQIRIFSGPCFPVFDLNTKIYLFKYGVFSGPYFPVFELITEKDGTEKTPYLDAFHAVNFLTFTKVTDTKICLFFLPKKGRKCIAHSLLSTSYLFPFMLFLVFSEISSVLLLFPLLLRNSCTMVVLFVDVNVASDVCT